jgi:hypothetical protein
MYQRLEITPFSYNGHKKTTAEAKSRETVKQ